WFFGSVPPHDGSRHCVLRVSRLTDVLSPGLRLCGRALGAPSYLCHLVGQFIAGLYVFQSLMVARAFRLCGRAIPVLLAQDADQPLFRAVACPRLDRKSTRLNSSHVAIAYAVFCLKKKSAAVRDAADPADALRLAGRDRQRHPAAATR